MMSTPTGLLIRVPCFTITSTLKISLGEEYPDRDIKMTRLGPEMSPTTCAYAIAREKRIARQRALGMIPWEDRLPRDRKTL